MIGSEIVCNPADISANSIEQQAYKAVGYIINWATWRTECEKALPKRSQSHFVQHNKAKLSYVILTFLFGWKVASLLNCRNYLFNEPLFRLSKLLDTRDKKTGQRRSVMACHHTIDSEGFAWLYHDNVYTYFEFPRQIISDRRSVFVSEFSKALFKLEGI